MKIPRQISLKKATTIILISVLLTVIISYYAFAATPTSTFTISPGIYPGAPSYTIWKEGTNYFAKNSNGKIEFSSTNASYIIQQAINNAPNGGKIFIRNVGEAYFITQTIIIAEKRVILESDFATLKSNGADPILLIKSPNQLLGQGASYIVWNTSQTTVRNIKFEGDKTQEGVKVEAYYNAIIENCFFRNLEKGIVIASGDKWTECTTVRDCHIEGCRYGIYFEAEPPYYNCGFSHIETVKIQMQDDNCYGIYWEYDAYSRWNVIEDIMIWIHGDNSYGIYCSGDLTDTVFIDIFIENFKENPTAVYGVCLSSGLKTSSGGHATVYFYPLPQITYQGSTRQLTYDIYVSEIDGRRHWFVIDGDMELGVSGVVTIPSGQSEVIHHNWLNEKLTVENGVDWDIVVSPLQIMTDVDWCVQKVNATHFKIQLSSPATSDWQFTWTAMIRQPMPSLQNLQG